MELLWLVVLVKKQGKVLSGRKILPRFWPEIEREKRQRHYIVTVPENRIRKINIPPFYCTWALSFLWKLPRVKKLCFWALIKINYLNYLHTIYTWRNLLIELQLLYYKCTLYTTKSKSFRQGNQWWKSSFHSKLSKGKK